MTFVWHTGGIFPRKYMAGQLVNGGRRYQHTVGTGVKLDWLITDWLRNEQVGAASILSNRQ